MLVLFCKQFGPFVTHFRHIRHMLRHYGLIMRRPAPNQANIPLYPYLAYCGQAAATNGQLTKMLLTEFWLFFTLELPRTHSKVHSQLSKVPLNSLSSKQTQQTNTVCICIAPRANVTEGKQKKSGRDTLGLLY